MTFSQKTKEQKSEELEFLKDQTEINIVFLYEDLTIGIKSESEYLKEKVESKNNLESGSGEKWLAKWNKDKEDVYPEKYITAFNEAFVLKRIKFKAKQDSTLKYTLIVKTLRIEPGFATLPVVYSGANSDFEFKFVETMSPDKHLCKLKILNVKGTGEYDTANRIGECYAIAGDTFARYILEYVFKARR